MSLAAYPFAMLLAQLQSGQPLELPGWTNTAPDYSFRREQLQALLLAGARLHNAQEQVTQVADSLRRDQKFVRPGPISPHLVQLRKQQALARQGLNHAQRDYVLAAKHWVQSWSLTVPAQLTVDAFANRWLLTQFGSSCG